MIFLKSEQRHLIKSLLTSNNSHYPLLKAIIAGKKAGKVYVNSTEPSAACVISTDGWCYFLGDELNAEFNSELTKVIVDLVLNQQVPILWFGIPATWRRIVNQAPQLKGYHSIRIQYSFDAGAYVPLKQSMFPYIVESIDNNNVDAVIEYCSDISTFWEPPTSLAKNGLGYIALDQHKVIGHVISASVEDGKVEIDISTDENYRGNGIAKQLTSHLIDECLKRSLTPKWDCAANNEASVNFAKKLGFKKVKEYSFSYIVANTKE